MAARNMAIPRSRLSDISAGRKGVSADTALRFERCLGISVVLLIRLQAEYDLSKAVAEKALRFAGKSSQLLILHWPNQVRRAHETLWGMRFQGFVIGLSPTNPWASRLINARLNCWSRMTSAAANWKIMTMPQKTTR